MRIVSGKLSGVPFKAAQAAGRKLVNPTAIVYHDTSDARAGQAVSWFTSPECNTSAHVVVERDGSVTQLVRFDTVAFHAGKSELHGRSGCNAFTIGVEIVNPGMMERRGNEVLLIYRSKSREGKTVEKIIARYPVAECREVNTKEHGRGWCLPYTQEQIDTVTDVSRTLVQAYPSIQEATTHWFVSPRRKVDTNPLFPLEAVREATFRPAAPEAMEVPGPEVSERDEDSEEVAEAEHAPEEAEVSTVAASVSADTSEGFLSNRNFAKLNTMADQGSRIAGWIRSIKRWFWGTTTTVGGAAMLVDTKKGSANGLVELVSDHPFIAISVVGLVLGVGVYFGIKLVEKHLVTAYRSGRYRPRAG